MQTTSEQKQNNIYNSLGGINMFKLMKKRIKNEKGLTLIELLAVIVILAIVAAIAIPSIGNIIDNSRVKAAKADAANILSAANIYFTENAGETTFSGSVSDTGTPEWKSYINDLGTVSTFTVLKVDTGNTVETTGTSGKAYTISAATLKGLEIDKGNTDSDTFSWTTTTTTP